MVALVAEAQAVLGCVTRDVGLVRCWHELRNDDELNLSALSEPEALDGGGLREIRREEVTDLLASDIAWVRFLVVRLAGRTSSPA